MTHDELVKWVDALEDALSRAEKAKKDIDLIMILRWGYATAKDMLKESKRNDSSN